MTSTDRPDPSATDSDSGSAGDAKIPGLSEAGSLQGTAPAPSEASKAADKSSSARRGDASTAEPLQDDSTDRLGPDGRRKMIEAIGLSKFYGPFAAARDVTFSVHEGELVAFLGPNGAGKSTTMKMLTGYIAASEGEARIAGYNMMENRIEGSRHLGYLPENGPLYPEMTPAAMLDFFAEARGMSKADKADRIAAVVDICDLSSVLHKPISKLSKGFKQRVGMSQSLLHEPDVLILDEPTAGLDPNQIRGVRKTMRRLSETKTILLSTHILQEVEAMADRVVMINEGRIVYVGEVDRLREVGSGDLDEAFHQLTREESV